MAFPRIGGIGIPLGLQQQASVGTTIQLAAGEVYMIPAGTYHCCPGPFTSLQYADPISSTSSISATTTSLTGQRWVTINGENSLAPLHLDSDGANFRLANLSGCAVGALITNSGASYTNGIGATATGLTVTASAGSSTWCPVVGGAINSTVTITAGGTGYLLPPILLVSPPPAGGIPATMTCTISGGAINAVTVVNQGAGYTAAPTVTVLNDPRDTAGSGGILTVNATLTNSGGLTALYPLTHGTVQTSVPTFTFAPASTTAATMIMNFTVTGFTVGAGGSTYGNAQPFGLFSIGGIVSGTRASNVAGPINDTLLTQPRMAMISGTSTAGGAIQTTGAVVVDPGFGFQAIPSLGVLPAGNALPTVIAQATATVGGTSDQTYLQPI